MKKIFYLAVLITAVFTSCQKDTLAPEEPLSSVPQNTIKPLEASDKMLSFNSEEEMYTEIERLMMSNGANSNTMTISSGFTSINDIYEQALADLDIVDKMKSIKMADQVKEKYQPYLLYNDDPADDEINNPYIKTDFRLAYVCNKNGDVIINGEVKNFNIAKSAKETEIYKLTNPVETKWYSQWEYIYHVNGVKIYERDNSLHIDDAAGERRMYAFPYRDSPAQARIYIRMYGKKKTWRGWHDYKTAFYVKYVSINESSWSRPLTDLNSMCFNDKTNYHYLGDYVNRHIYVGYSAVNGDFTSSAFRIYSQGVAPGHGILRINTSKMPYSSPI